DVESVRLSQARTASFQPQLLPDDGSLVTVPFEFSPANLEIPKIDWPDWENGPHVKEEEFTRAEALALFDYLRKSKSHGFVVSLSGGADSEATVCLVHLMVALGLKELGAEGFKA